MHRKAKARGCIWVAELEAVSIQPYICNSASRLPVGSVNSLGEGERHVCKLSNVLKAFGVAGFSKMLLFSNADTDFSLT